MGFDDLVNKAKDLLGQGGDKATDGTSSAASGVTDKIKEVATDERIDQVAGAIMDKTPDNVDSVVNTVADKAKEMN